MRVIALTVGMLLYLLNCSWAQQPPKVSEEDARQAMRLLELSFRCAVPPSGCNECALWRHQHRTYRFTPDIRVFKLQANIVEKGISYGYTSVDDPDFGNTEGKNPEPFEEKDTLDFSFNYKDVGKVITKVEPGLLLNNGAMHLVEFACRGKRSCISHCSTCKSPDYNLQVCDKDTAEAVRDAIKTLVAFNQSP